MRDEVELSPRAWQYGAAVALAALVAVVMLPDGFAATVGVASLIALATVGLIWLRQPRTIFSEGSAEVEAGWSAVAAEVRRSRRHNRAFVLLAVRGDAAAARSLRPLLRTPDRAWVDRGITYVLLAECDTQQAHGFVSRARAHVPDAFRAGNFALAVFPTDAITVGGLLETLNAAIVFVPERSAQTPQVT
ncbi:MAG: hypothetical protein M3N29_01100 [Chloroflexota bacterium]|nr:hypothetical protein [Chloroflexota bacterium]